MELEEGDIVLCTVDKIVGTTVFVNIEGNGEGTIITSEIAPGRIRNLREYVVPKKKIVCKILKISGDKIHLSLRRVSQKEQKEVLEQYKQEKSYRSILKSILGNKTEDIIKKIKEKTKLYDFLQEAKQNPKELEKVAGKKESEKILEIINKQKQKKAVIKKEIHLKTTASEGLELIKKLLGKIKDVEIKYISAGKYSVKTESSDIKKADNYLKEILEELEKQAKKANMEFSVKEK